MVRDHKRKVSAVSQDVGMEKERRRRIRWDEMFGVATGEFVCEPEPVAIEKMEKILSKLRETGNEPWIRF